MRSPSKFKRYTAVLLIGAMGVVSGCETTGGSAGGGDQYASMSPAERRWHESNRQFNRTVAKGAVAGAVAGALVGALVSKNKVTGALVGAAAGAAIGAGVGYYVATKNRQYANREDELNAKITAADKEAVAYRQTADAAEEYAAWQRQRIRKMKADLRAKRVSQQQYNAEREKTRKQVAVMRKRSSEAKKVHSEIDLDKKRLANSGKKTRNLAQSEADLLRSSQRFDKAANDLEAEL